MKHSLRAALDRFYRCCGLISAIFVVLMTLAILGQIISRLPFVDVVFDAVEISGFCLAASLFLGLAYTLKAGAHIRVGLLVGALPTRAKRWVELWCTSVAAALTAYASYHAALMNLDSWKFGDLSAGLAAIPLWVPQLAMTFGLIALTVAFLDEFFLVLSGRPVEFRDSEALDVEEILKAPAPLKPRSA